MELARSLDESHLFGAAALGFGGPWVAMGVVDEALLALLEDAAHRLGGATGALRAKVLSRLAMELYFAEGSLGRRTSLADEALEVASALGDRQLRAEVLAARHFALWGPDNVEERLADATSIAQIAREIRSDELALAGHHWRIIDLVELGDVIVADREIESMAKLAERVRIPVFLWQVALHRAARAHFAGRFAEAERFAFEALEHGRRAQPESADASFAVHMLALRRDQGRVAEIVERAEQLARRNPGFAVLEIYAACAHAELGRRATVTAELARLEGKGFTNLPRAYWWLGTIASLAEIVTALGDRDRARVLYDLLSPFARRNVVQGRASAWLGSAARYLGLLAFTLERYDEAARHFEEALRHNVLMGARPFEARTRLEHARTLLVLGEREKAAVLASEAREIADELGMGGLWPGIETLLVELASGQAPPAPASAGNAFLREGQFWTLRFQGRVVRLKDSRGLELMAWLLRHPGREFHAIELASVTSAATDRVEIGARAIVEDGLSATRLEGGDD
ncbi:MAG: hypothetical protein ACREQQ_05055, partial [Candidatus Binatia bacterium]